MGKLTPEERWRRCILERFAALEVSGELEALRAEGLALMNRSTLLSAEEWHHQDIRKLLSSVEYLRWYRKCEETSARYGLADWVVRAACLLKGFTPENEMLAIESKGPRIRVVTEISDPLYLQWLCYEAGLLGLNVIQSIGSTENVLITLDNNPPLQSLTPSSKPPRDRAFYLRVETPGNYPPEAAAQLHKKASNLGRALLRRLGYPTPQRLRSSPLVVKAKQLKAGKSRLTEAECLEIIDKLYPDHELGSDRELLRRSHSAKYKVRSKIVKPYQQKS